MHVTTIIILDTESLTPRARAIQFKFSAVVPRYRDPQVQVTENLCYLLNLCRNIFQCFKN